MIKKILSVTIVFFAALVFYAVRPDHSAGVVFAAADYGSSDLEIFARRVASEINSRRAAAGLEPIRLCAAAE